ncbi:binding-protein-dependent transport systems inner membrane component [Sulfobacillus acidophilus TPY]|uniref:ABC-type transporter, integral membrane subunit n=1 Tax=Sulfobacillus acidophilus (strain ATCC 700253 / DSM 10332 / NAL) TaxID=679936 RepID=G8U1N4_SULAD|nr:binding-protein-dependent transport systems inner membrane component [Sulfobacillus acidophilus TPY]AEW06639.1 ABC-type transporter, integral membrane subunit [Sulfobacillus acidophilus DSM 10332]
MTLFVVRRLVSLIPVAFLVLLVTFSLIHLTPGNPAYTILGEEASRRSVALLDQKLGLNHPIWWQLVHYLEQVATGNLGQSLINGQPVFGLIVSRLPVTGELALVGLVGSLLIALPSGLLSAARPNRWIDATSRILALIGAAVPNFWLALVLVYLFSVTWHWFPSLGWVPLSQGLGANLWHLVLPAGVLALQLAAITARILRGEMLEVIHALYIQTARAKGAPERTVLLKHAFRNALIPVATVVGLQMGTLLGGVVITETIFSLPGMGQLVVNAIFERDYPVLDGTVLFMAFVVLISNLVVDVVYALLDPRIRYH